MARQACGRCALRPAEVQNNPFPNGKSVCWGCVENVFSSMSGLSLSMHEKSGEVPIFNC